MDCLKKTNMMRKNRQPLGDCSTAPLKTQDYSNIPPFGILRSIRQDDHTSPLSLNDDFHADN